ncbi:EAL domain-containing protein [Thiomicrospira sp. R3]|uniref:EAL domain-containing protein n=1 Tax=Thiomicrospira sp. R3 TaxID=3035472 RepID=UPI00259B7338|nr:EAL domain-containing protein [Thiomicrospira sp. R3]WFE69450.1 EAL domain-containing protein [Thiomicrospira sp. R3]
MKVKLENVTLFWSLFLPITLVVALIIVLIFVRVLELKQRSIEIAGHNAGMSIINMSLGARSFYASEVLPKIESAGLRISHDFESDPYSLPLPVNIMKSLGASQHSFYPDGIGKIKLFSDLPFTHNSKKDLDQFEREALHYLRNNVKGEYIKLERSEGEMVYRIAIADIFNNQSCVDCHNKHPTSPKRDWQLGDVRGVLSASVPLASLDESFSRAGNDLKLLLAGSFIFILLVVLVVARRFSVRVLSVSNWMEYVAKTGDLKARVELQSNDEVGQMVSAFNRLIRITRLSLRGVNRAVAGMAQGEFDKPVRLDLMGDFDLLKQNVNSSMSQVAVWRRELEKLANFDSVTHIPNRHSFNQKLEHWCKHLPVNGFVLVMIDLDNFKNVNDFEGHQAGDRVLASFAKLLCLHFPSTSTFFNARIGGDEFALLIPEPDDQHVLLMLKHLRDELDHLSDTLTISTKLSLSMGVCRFSELALTPRDLMRFADFAVYEAKTKGKNQACLFNQLMYEKINAEAQLEHRLKQAVINNEFFLVYQPQFDLRSLKPTGVEALIRWQSPEGLISPDQFIPNAEASGFINTIGSWVIDEALAQLTLWRNDGFVVEKCAVNVSNAQLQSRGFMTSISKKLKHFNVQAHQLDIEITESLLMEQKETDEQVIDMLQQQGMELSIDDFGTGYSSLSVIQNLKFDRLKIDRSFIQDIEHNPQSRAIVAAIINMGQELGLKVLAEGVENQAQLDCLISLGCDEAQGFYLGRPLTAKLLAEHLGEWV